MAATDVTVPFDINVREQLCIALTATLLAPSWSYLQWPHIRCWTDNRTAMARTNALCSSNRFAQNLNRCIGLAEAQHRCRISAAHLPGSRNVLADAGSRPHARAHRQVFANGISGWTQVQVPDRLRYIYKDFSSNFRPHHWPGVPKQRTPEHGISGASGQSRPSASTPASTSRPIGSPHRICHGMLVWIGKRDPQRGLDRAVQD